MINNDIDSIVIKAKTGTNILILRLVKSATMPIIGGNNAPPPTPTIISEDISSVNSGLC